jgi:hypothetical protein
MERLEVTRAELRGPIVGRFLDACGVSPRRTRIAEREAQAIARSAGGATLEVLLGDNAHVEVSPPELPLSENLQHVAPPVG